MLKSRNQLRLERRHQETLHPGTVQYVQQHRGPKIRRWWRKDLKAPAFARRTLRWQQTQQPPQPQAPVP